jgi:hypothetical protein
MKRPRNDPMTLNVFVDPAIERGAGRGSRHPVVNVSVFMGRSFEIAEKLLDESEAFTLLKEIEMPLVPMGVELVMDAWRRPTAAARWNNTSVDPGRRRTWTVRELCASPVTLSRAVRDLVPGTVLRNQREYQPSFSFWFGLEFGEVRGGDRGPGDVVGEVARVAAEAAGVMRVIDRWRRRSKG